MSKTSVGASELVEVLKVSNLAETVKKFQENGFAILAADVSADAVSLYDFEFPEKFLLVLGSEGEGIQKLIMRYVDPRVYIPMRGRIDSLNVSQAAAASSPLEMPQGAKSPLKQELGPRASVS